MLKVYTDKKFLKAQFRKKLFPILLDVFYLKNKKVLKYYSLVNESKQADIAIFPIEFSFALTKYKNEVKKFISQAKEKGLPIWVYTGGDIGFSLKDEDIYNFRLGGFKSKLNQNTFIMPSFIKDPYLEQIKSDFKTLRKTKLPQVGFVGHADDSFIKLLAELKSYLKINIVRLSNLKKADYQPFYPSSKKRYKYLKLMSKDNNIVSNFILRKQYRAGAGDIEKKIKTTKVFYNNIYNNPYTFCMRGGGNFSVRFYETLASGRIPILLDTDCLLPLSDNINWHEHVLIISYKDRNNLPKKIYEFHETMNIYEFEKFQNDNRTLWLEKLERVSYFIQIHNIFTTKK